METNIPKAKEDVYALFFSIRYDAHAFAKRFLKTSIEMSELQFTAYYANYLEEILKYSDLDDLIVTH